MFRITPDELALIHKYEPLVAAELRRIGVSEQDQSWIHAGSSVRPTEALYEEWLTRLRALPSEFGVEAYCETLGFDYDETKKRIFSREDLP